MEKKGQKIVEKKSQLELKIFRVGIIQLAQLYIKCIFDILITSSSIGSEIFRCALVLLVACIF